MRTALWRGIGLVLFVAFATAPAPAAVAAESSSVEISIDTVMVIPPSLPFFWGFPSLSGTFEATGDVEDEGAASASFWLKSYGWWGSPPESYWLFTLDGESGDISLTIHIQTGNWTVTGGTGDYAGATGSGTSTCTVTQTASGANYAYTLTGSVDA